MPTLENQFCVYMYMCSYMCVTQYIMYVSICVYLCVCMYSYFYHEKEGGESLFELEI